MPFSKIPTISFFCSIHPFIPSFGSFLHSFIPKSQDAINNKLAKGKKNFSSIIVHTF
jgi:hypothetical protein